MVTATAFQILVSNSGPIKAITDNAVVTLEVRLSMHRQGETCTLACINLQIC